MLEIQDLGRRVVPLSGAVSPRWGMDTLPTGKHDAGHTGGATAGGAGDALLRGTSASAPAMGVRLVTRLAA